MTSLKIRSKGDSVRLLQELLNKAGYQIAATGDFDRTTEQAVMDFQRKNNLISDGIVGSKTWTVLQNRSSKDFRNMQAKYLAEQDLIDLATTLNLPVACIKAVYEVESSGRGFLPDGRPKILFEGHIFWKRLKNKNMNPQTYVSGNEDILYPAWTTKFYKGGTAEYNRLEKAKKIHEDSALESASWGVFQIMGYHYSALGYNSVKDFVTSCFERERNHLMDFGKFIECNGLTKHLKKLDWVNFAYRYNGSGYQKNKYDARLAKAYQKYCV
jgi:hypothetical protein